jgi:hypothetical protein
MVLFWIVAVVLVLGGLIALWGNASWLRGLWLQAARVKAPARRPVWQRNGGRSRPDDLQGRFLPPPRVVTRAGPPPRPLT